MKRLFTLFFILLCVVGVSEIYAQKYTASGYITYTIDNATKKWLVEDTSEGGLTCTSAQGMAVGSTYCYVAKQKDEAYCDITRFNMDTGSKTMMCYYASLTATKESECDIMGHANELEIVEKVGENKETWLFVSTLKKPNGVARLKVVGDKMYLAGFYKMINASNGGNINASALKYVKTVGNDMYFIVKNVRGFYTAKFPLNDLGGTASNPTEVKIYKMFNIDVRNAVFATSNSAYSTRDGIDGWANQGFGYNPIQQVFYVPVWQSTSGSQMHSAILTYNVADYIIDENWENQRIIGDYIFPTKTGFMMSRGSGTFEIETASYRTGKSDKLYFNTNCNVKDYEAVFEVAIGATDFTPINEGKAVYTIKYNSNGGTGSMSSTKHIQGIGSCISANTFTRTNYTFGGWYMHRASDDTWLYVKGTTYAWYKKGEQPAEAVLATREDEHKFSTVTNVDGDVITLYAYWQPNVISGTKKFYIRYDGNGGTGTMEETAVTYKTTTKTASNAFVREGYTFVGWTAYRHNKQEWVYKGNFANYPTTEVTDSWRLSTEDKTGYIFKTYANGAGVASTTSVDADVVTFYANWAQVADGAIPQKVTLGSDFDISGKLTCTTDLYGVIVNVKNSVGDVLQSYTAETYASRTTASGGFDLAQANDAIDFSTLEEGNYTYEVIAQAIAGTSPYSVTVHSSEFAVVKPTPTGIEEIKAENNIPAVYYNLQGVEVANPENGLYIRIQGDKATKVLIK